LAEFKEEKEAEELLQQSFEKFKKVIELGGICYNLACLYALKANKKEALYYLDLSLNKKEISVSFAQNYEDWKNLITGYRFFEHFTQAQKIKFKVINKHFAKKNKSNYKIVPHTVPS
jgi:hypothetical protein